MSRAEVEAFVAKMLEDEPYLDEVELRLSIEEAGRPLDTAWDVNEGEDFRPELECA